MHFAFTKMHGLGNDFVVFDCTSRSLALTTQQVRFIADRRRGIGCDQVLLVSSSSSKGVDFRYRIFNADGGEVEQCGNGARCFARFVRDKGLTEKDESVVETAAGIIRLVIEADGEVSVEMGRPRFDPDDIPFVADRKALDYALRVGEEVFTVGVVSMGNPHAVLRVDEVDSAPVVTLGPRIEHHDRFPSRTNVGFMQVIDRRRIRLRVFERGVGETLACGTGACAAVCAGRRWSLLDEQVEVGLAGGTLLVRWDGRSGPVWMKGPAETVYEGYIEL